MLTLRQLQEAQKKNPILVLLSFPPLSILSLLHLQDSFSSFNQKTRRERYITNKKKKKMGEEEYTAKEEEEGRSRRRRKRRRRSSMTGIFFFFNRKRKGGNIGGTLIHRISFLVMPICNRWTICVYGPMGLESREWGQEFGVCVCVCFSLWSFYAQWKLEGMRIILSGKKQQHSIVENLQWVKQNLTCSKKHQNCLYIC